MNKASRAIEKTNDNFFWLLIFLLIILTVGEPDLLTAITKYVGDLHCASI